MLRAVERVHVLVVAAEQVGGPRQELEVLGRQGLVAIGGGQRLERVSPATVRIGLAAGLQAGPSAHGTQRSRVLLRLRVQLSKMP